MDIKIRNKFIEIKNSISDWFVIFVTNNNKNVSKGITIFQEKIKIDYFSLKMHQTITKLYCMQS